MNSFIDWQTVLHNHVRYMYMYIPGMYMYFHVFIHVQSYKSDAYTLQIIHACDVRLKPKCYKHCGNKFSFEFIARFWIFNRKPSFRTCVNNFSRRKSCFWSCDFIGSCQVFVFRTSNVSCSRYGQCLASLCTLYLVQGKCRSTSLRRRRFGKETASQIFALVRCFDEITQQHQRIAVTDQFLPIFSRGHK